jgi:hypothetical protein
MRLARWTATLLAAGAATACASHSTSTPRRGLASLDDAASVGALEDELGPPESVRSNAGDAGRGWYRWRLVGDGVERHAVAPDEDRSVHSAQGFITGWDLVVLADSEGRVVRRAFIEVGR